MDVLSEYDSRGLGVIGMIPEYEGQRLSADVVPVLEVLGANGWEIDNHSNTLR